MRISDTMSGKLHEVDGKKISIYLCGVTVYDKSHIGHARTIVVFDVLCRHLELNGINVKLVQNFTDVDDKIRLQEQKNAQLAWQSIKNLLYFILICEYTVYCKILN